ncbi:MAG: hypothetical protein KDD52_03225 [Bdellovibrionales bacterium]|nr:hypothetical protein [Bdellovibrionales bacterium]
MKTKFIVGQALAALLIVVASQTATAQIDTKQIKRDIDDLESGRLVPRVPSEEQKKIRRADLDGDATGGIYQPKKAEYVNAKKHQTKDGWFDIVDSEGNFIVQVNTKEGSLEYEICKENCSEEISIQTANTYKRGTQLQGREILFNKSDGQGGEYTLLSLYKDKDGQNVGGTLGRRSTWSIKQVNGAFTFDFDDKDEVAILMILNYDRREKKELEKDKGWFQVMDADGNHIVELDKTSLGYSVCNAYQYKNCSTEFKVEIKDITVYDSEIKADIITGRVIMIKNSMTDRTLITYSKKGEGKGMWSDIISSSVSSENKANGLGIYISIH